jgi:flagellar hook protein FlgE
VNQSLSVQVQGSKIVVGLGTNSLGQATSDLQSVVDEINAHPEASLLVGAALPAAADPTATAGAFSQRFLQNGAGPNLGDYFTFNTTASGGATVQNISVAKDGTIIGVFDNGTSEELARVAVGNVTNPEGLLSVGSGKFAESPTSGSGFPPQTAGTAGTGTIAAGFLEMSNVDLTREFTDMITTQRGFQANSKIITTSDEMIQDLLTLKR